MATKQETVKKLEELILFIKPHFTHVTLSDDERIVTAGGKDFNYKIGVECDSNAAIIKDVVDVIIYK